MAILRPHRQFAFRTQALAGMGIWVVLLFCCASARAQAVTEYQLKGEFLYRFANFTEWPGSSPSSPIRICVLGSNPFGNRLEQAIHGKSADGHPLTLKHLDGVDEADTCQILFISSSEKRRVSAILHSLSNHQILTVGDMDDFCQKGGIIGFRMVDNKIRLAVNIDAAERAHIKISARLLGLAMIVRDGSQ